MTQSLVVLFVALAITVAAALGIVYSFIRARSPREGVREWVRDATDAWKRDELGDLTSGSRDVSIDDLMDEAQPAERGEEDSGETEARAAREAEAPILPSFEPSGRRRRPTRAQITQGEGSREGATGEETPATPTESGTDVEELVADLAAEEHEGDGSVETGVSADECAEESAEESDEPRDGEETEAVESHDVQENRSLASKRGEDNESVEAPGEERA